MDKRTLNILAESPQRVDLAQHARKCSVCRHPERDAIEEAFLHWHDVSNITREFHLPGRTALYRHARALGLFARRSRNLRFALGLIIEQAEAVTPTAEAVVRAVRAYTRVTDTGEWIEPPAHVVVSSGSAQAVRDVSAPGETGACLAPSPPALGLPPAQIAPQTETGHDAGPCK